MYFDFDGCKLYFDDWNILSMFALMYITKPFIACAFGTRKLYSGSYQLKKKPLSQPSKKKPAALTKTST